MISRIDVKARWTTIVSITSNTGQNYYIKTGFYSSNFILGNRIPTSATRSRHRQDSSVPQATRLR